MQGLAQLDRLEPWKPSGDQAAAGCGYPQLMRRVHMEKLVVLSQG